MLTAEQAQHLGGILILCVKYFLAESTEYIANLIDLAEHEVVVSVFESRVNVIHTTHSWEFLGIDSINQYTNNQLTVDSEV